MSNQQANRSKAQELNKGYFLRDGHFVRAGEDAYPTIDLIQRCEERWFARSAHELR